jgi:hypothetical protein
MKGLMTYGAVNEKKENNGGAMEYHSLGADGKSYGIIRENQKFYIKVAPKSKKWLLRLTSISEVSITRKRMNILLIVMRLRTLK